MNAENSEQSIESYIVETLGRLQSRTDSIYAAVRSAAAKVPHIDCDRHNRVRLVDIDASARETHAAGGEVRLIYEACPLCHAEEASAIEGRWMASKGVPPVSLHASFANFKPKTTEQETALSFARIYAGKLHGFLLLVGDRSYGLGKTHLAVAIMRVAGCGRFISHDTLMAKVGARYADQFAEDIVASCQKTKLLVLDELGISRGGKDELPVIHRILCWRYEQKLPTVITSNLSLDALKQYVGERMTDRLRESVIRICEFKGTSNSRKERRQTYLGE